MCRLFLRVALAVGTVLPASAVASVGSSYLYDLASFTGVIPLMWPRIAVDQKTNEVFVLEGTDVRIFDENGMEIYDFATGGELGVISDIAVTPDGNILLLSARPGRSQWQVSVRNYRGEPVRTIAFSNLPSMFASSFLPGAMVYRDGRLYLVDKDSLKVLAADLNGAFVDGYDLPKILGMDEKKVRDNIIDGFNVDREGNLLFTISTLFRAYRVSPDRKVVGFGTRGSAPGHFNIAAGIDRDDDGRYYIVDSLRAVVMIFNKDLQFQAEFGYRGYGPGNLIVPKDLAIDARNRLYVTQGGKRGVSVFQVRFQ